MNTELFGWLLGAGIIGVQVILIYFFGNLLSVFTDKVLSEIEKRQ